MCLARIYDRVLIVLVFVMALSLYGGDIAFGGEPDGADGSTVIYSTGGGLGEAYVPKPRKKRAPRQPAFYNEDKKPAEPAGGLGEAYVPKPRKKSAPRQPAFYDEVDKKPTVKSTTKDGPTVIYNTGGGLGEGYVAPARKKSRRRHLAGPDEVKKPIKSSVIYTTGEGAAKASSDGSIAPGWQPSDDHSLDFFKGLLRKVMPAAKSGEAEKRASEVGDTYSVPERAPVAVITTTDDGKAGSTVVDGGIAPGWQPSENHSLDSTKRFFQRLIPGGSSGKVEDSEAGAPAKAVSPSGVAADSEDIEVPEEAALATDEVEQYLDDEDDEFDDSLNGEAPAVADPLEGFNRAMFTVNDRLYFWVFRPLANGYSFVVPEPGRVAVKRFFANVFMPVRFANNVFQLKFKNAGVEVERFVINTTIGVAGFMDPAKSIWNLEMHDEDFGQTLGFYGFGPGLYINLPVFGPSNVRDALGMVADIFLSPMAYILPNDREIVIGIDAFKRLNEVSLNIGLYEDIKRDALDPYIFIRNAYQQHRVSVIKE